MKYENEDPPDMQRRAIRFRFRFVGACRSDAFGGSGWHVLRLQDIPEASHSQTASELLPRNAAFAPKDDMLKATMNETMQTIKAENPCYSYFGCGEGDDD